MTQINNCNFFDFHHNSFMPLIGPRSLLWEPPAYVVMSMSLYLTRFLFFLIHISTIKALLYPSFFFFSFFSSLLSVHYPMNSPADCCSRLVSLYGCKGNGSDWTELYKSRNAFDGQVCVCVFSFRSVCFVFVLCVYIPLYCISPSLLPSLRHVGFISPPPSAITAS